jgi:hypothetical protein
MICKLKTIVLVLSAFFTLAVLPSENAVAQSALFNVPSTDVVPEKKTYLELDLISHLESHRDGGFQTYVPRAVFGLGHSLEAGISVTFTDAFAPDQPVEIQPNAKWQFYTNEEKGVAIAAGGILFVPVKNRAGTDTFGMIYSTVSKKVKAGYGPRFTGGAYALVGRANGTGSESGAIVGYEQPLHSRVNFVADWFSGKNRFGYVTPGFSITVSKTSSIYAGYSIGNQGRKNNGLFVYYGITF